jgi:FkbM family methyltransferase
LTIVKSFILSFRHFLAIKSRKLFLQFYLLMISRLSKRIKADIFVKLGQELNVKVGLLHSKLGAFEGYLQDEGLFKYAISDGVWAEDIICIIRQLTSKDNVTFVDIGANIGLVCIPVAMNSSVKVIAIEPNPACCVLLKNNIDRAGLINVTVINKAVYITNDAVEFELSNNNFGDGRIRLTPDPSWNEHFGESGRTTIRVPSQPLDQILDTEVAGPLIIKADIQGSEAFLASGGARTLAKTDVLIVEFWPYGIARLGYRPEVVFEKLMEFFDMGCTVDGFLQGGEWFGVADLNKLIAKQSTNRSNYHGMDLILAKKSLINERKSLFKKNKG